MAGSDISPNVRLALPNPGDPSDPRNLQAIQFWANNFVVNKIVAGSNVGVASQTQALGPGAAGTGIVGIDSSGGYASLTGAGETASPGALAQNGPWSVSDTIGTGIDMRTTGLARLGGNTAVELATNSGVWLFARLELQFPPGLSFLSATDLAHLPTPLLSAEAMGFTEDGNIYFYPSGGPWTLVASSSAPPGSGVTSFNTRTGAVTLTAADVEHLFTAAGQLFVGTGTNTGELLARGTPGQVLTVGGADPSGLEWAAPVTSGWVADANTWTYSSTDGHTFVVTVNADITGNVGLGDRVWLTNQSASQYFIVTKISVSTGTTTVTIYGGTSSSLTNTAITNPFYSHAKSPFGFPMDPAVWTETASLSTTGTHASPATSTWYNLGALQLVVPIGIWYVKLRVLAYLANTTAAAAYSMYVALSTSASTAGTAAFNDQVYGYCAASTGFAQQVAITGELALTAKATYFANAMTDAGSGVTSINFYYPSTNQGTNLVSATCAYL